MRGLEGASGGSTPSRGGGGTGWLTAVLLAAAIGLGLWAAFLPSGFPFLGPIRFVGFFIAVSSLVFSLSNRSMAWFPLLIAACLFLMVSWESYYFAFGGKGGIPFIPKPWLPQENLQVEQFLRVSVNDFSLGPLWQTGRFWFAVIFATTVQLTQAWAGSKVAQVEGAMTAGERRALLYISYASYALDTLCAFAGLTILSWHPIAIIGAGFQIIISVFGAEACYLGASGGFKAIGSYAKFLGGKGG